MDIDIDYSVEAFTTALEAVVNELGPDYEYPETDREFGSCVYVKTVDGVRKGSCIIGRVVEKLGVPLEFVEEQIPAEMLLERLGWSDDRIMLGAQNAQSVQDRLPLNATFFQDRNWRNYGAALEAYRRGLNAS